MSAIFDRNTRDQGTPLATRRLSDYSRTAHECQCLNRKPHKVKQLKTKDKLAPIINTIIY